MAGSHDNIFRPFEHHPAPHEDHLSRAAVLVMRSVPLAYQCLLDLAGPGCHATAPYGFSVAELPSGEFHVQRKSSFGSRGLTRTP
jgi:hypothetical protein